jgi:cellulose biosynthesis protein BcsQ
MANTSVEPFVIDGVSLRPPDHLTVIGSEHIKGGGTTKTTNCMMTAFALVALGYRVRVVSYDREHSSVSWADKAARGLSAFQVGKPLPWPDKFEVENADTLEDLVELVHDYDGDYVIIDGGPADPDSVQTVAALCHYVILPMEPGPLVLEQAPVTVSLVQEVSDAQGREIDVRVLLVRVNLVTRVARTTREILDGSEIVVMDVMIGDATGIKEAAHQVPRRLYGWDRVVRELLGDGVTTGPNGKEPTS